MKSGAVLYRALLLVLDAWLPQRLSVPHQPVRLRLLLHEVSNHVVTTRIHGAEEGRLAELVDHVDGGTPEVRQAQLVTDARPLHEVLHEVQMPVIRGLTDANGPTLSTSCKGVRS